MITDIDRHRISKIVGEIIDLRSTLLNIRMPYLTSDKPQVAVIDGARQNLYDAASNLQLLVDSLKR